MDHRGKSQHNRDGDARAQAATHHSERVRVRARRPTCSLHITSWILPRFGADIEMPSTKEPATTCQKSRGDDLPTRSGDFASRRDTRVPTKIISFCLLQFWSVAVRKNAAFRSSRTSTVLACSPVACASTAAPTLAWRTPRRRTSCWVALRRRDACYARIQPKELKESMSFYEGRALEVLS